MKPYETLFFTEPEISEDGLGTLLTKIEGAITRYGGEVEKVSKWGRRMLAYRVDKFNEGYYVMVDFKGTGDVLRELERFYLINQNVLRFLTTSRIQ